MKKFVFVLFLVLISLLDVSAQSGRRIKTAPVPAAPPTVLSTIDTGASGSSEDQSVGYSESAPSAARPIYSAGRKRANSGKPQKPKVRDAKNSGGEKSNQSIANQPAAPASGESSGIETEEVLKVETSLISIPVSVYDRGGIYIPDLRKENFKIFEDGTEQEVAYFGKSDKPFSVVLLIDVSPSTAYKIEEIQDAAIEFVNQLMPQDQVVVVQFDNDVKVLTELTNDRAKIVKAIRRTGFGDGTSLYEAVDDAFRRRLKNVEGRKAIVLFTDGVDTTSLRASFESTLGDAEESEAIVFPIYYNTFLNNLGIGTGGVMTSTPSIGFPGGGGGRGASTAEYARGRAYLEGLAASTGGRVFRPENIPGGLPAAFRGIAEELRSQYNLGYYPQAEGTAGQRKQIRVRVDRPRLIVRSRDSYIVGANSDSAEQK